MNAGLALVGLLLAAPSGAAPGPEARQAFRMVRLAVDATGGGDATLGPDGRRFLSTSKRTGNWEVWMFDIAAARWTQLTDHPAEDFEGRWSPDGRSIAFTSDRAGSKDVWLLEPDSGRLRQLTSADGEDEYPDWTVDGKYVTYTGGPWGARDVFMVPAAGGEPRRLTRRSGRAGACAAEPGGASLVCHRYDSGTGDVLRLWLADGQETPLTDGSPWDYKPTAAPDGKWVAFSRAIEGPSQVWLLPLGDGRPRRLTRSPHNDRWPTWSADGTRLFFHRLVEQGRAVKLLDRRSGQARTLVGAAEAPLQASLSPDGRRLAYCALAGGRRAVRVLDLGEGATHTFASGAYEACFPRWSPDGTHLAFVAKESEDARWEVSVARADGGERVVLTAGQGGLRGMDGPLDWSPDGTRLLFHADTLPFEADLYTIDVRTRRLERLTDDAWFDEAPSWTPDGKGIVFMSTRGGNWTWGLYRLSLDNRVVEALAAPDWVEKNFPRGGPEGHTAWVMEDERGVRVLVERDPEGRVRHYTGAGERARWPTYANDGTALLFTEVEQYVEYWLVENPLGPGSPVLDPAAALLPALPKAAPEAGAHGAARLARSPVDLHHR